MAKAFVWLVLVLSLWLVPAVRAQDVAPNPAIPKVHVVAEGESLYAIAAQYGVTVDALEKANNLTDAAILQIGQRLLIPGAVGEPVGVRYTVQVGDTLQSIAAAFRATPAAIALADGLINPAYLVAGQTLALASQTGSEESAPIFGTPYVVLPSDTLSTVAARVGLSPAALADLNNLPFPTRLWVGQRLRLPGQQTYVSLPGAWQTIRARSLPLRQGEAFSLYVESAWDGAPMGRLTNADTYSQTLRFAPFEAGYVAMVGLDAFTAPGLYTLELGGSGSRPWEPFVQSVQVVGVDYGFQSINVGEDQSALLDPGLRAREDAYLSQFYGQFTPTPYWQGLFQAPLGGGVVSAAYGGSRSYNGGPVQIFHSGVDFGGPVGQPVLAPAGGVVIFNGLTDLRGQIIILDHGWGVTTGFYHLSGASVQVGDRVTAGQPIGLLGSTGLSTGPHLHWELRVNGMAVNGVQWLTTQFP